MPEYTYHCNNCKLSFSIVCSISSYSDNVKCEKCGDSCGRDCSDYSSLSTTVKLAHSEIKTVGHLAQRNTENMSQDQKAELHAKHNEYKYDRPEQALPKGMTRIKKPPKPKWT